MQELLLSTFIGLLSGVVSSMIFLWVLTLMRPNITISKEICKSSDANGTFYGFKIINNSRFHALDLKAELILNTPFNSPGGSNHSCEWITLRKDGLLQFPRYKRNDAGADYALILGTREDLDALWNSSAQYLEVKIYAKHSFSGIYKSFNQKYYTKNSCIMSGMYNFGKTFRIS